MRMTYLHNFVNHYWYKNQYDWLKYILLPFSWCYFGVILLRKWLYQKGILISTRLSVPVIVVGNITVGGTGKTPVVSSLVHFLRHHGFSPGVVSRGYTGKNKQSQLLNAQSLVNEVGDEPYWLYQTLACPVAIGRKRADAAKLLIDAGCDVIISDDGLQHYALARDIEIAVVDGLRLFGNGLLLPAGPLREPINRLNQVEMILGNQITIEQKHLAEEVLKQNKVTKQISSLELVPIKWRCLANNHIISLADFGQDTVHAVAGIANPDRFFVTLKQLGVSFIEHAFPDHYLFQPQDIHFNDQRKVVMTEKDGVKCQSFCKDNVYVLEVMVILPEMLQQGMLEQLSKLRKS